MLAEFQQALADCTASPALCLRVRADEAELDRYDLTPRERARLRAIVAHRGMEAACKVYRINRIAPLGMNARRTLAALGPDARRMVEEYWSAHPRGIAHFHLESARFCDWLQARADAGATVRAALTLDRAAIQAAIEATA